ncbi:Uncharacterised protein [Bordetella pertussis]|nr:Uncharacterised protein [Bordetella pertussis]
MRAAARFGLRVHLGARHRRHVGNPLEAVDARDFLDQVFLDLDVETVRRRRHDEVVALLLERQAQAGEDLRHFGTLHRHAQHTVAARQPHAHGLAHGQVDALVVDRAGLSAADVENEPGDQFDVLGDRGVVHAALEAVAGFGAELVAARAAGDRAGPPECRLEVDVARIQRHRGRFAAHDAGQALHLFAGHHHAHLGVQRDGLAVEQFERFAFARPAHGEIAADLVEIEHMRGTPHLEHDVVGNIDQGRHRTLAGTLQARLHPFGRRGARVDALDHAPGKAAAQIRGLDGDRQAMVDRDRHGLGRRRRERRAGQRGDFAGHTENGQAVGAIGRQLEREQGVVQIQRGADIGARAQRGRQFEQACMVLRQAQLARRAQHARGLHAAHLGHADLHAAGQFGAHARQRHGQARGRIGRAAHDLQQSARTVVDLAHAQLVGVGMGRDVDDARHHHAGKRRGGRLGFFDFQAGHGQPVRELIGADRRVDQRT